MSMRIDLEVLSSFDFIITTSTSDSEWERGNQRMSMGDLEVLSSIDPITTTSTSDSVCM